MALIVGSRGCDFGCKFCLSSKMFPVSQTGTRTLYREVENIIKEVKLCQNEFGSNCFFFVDLNFYGGDIGRIKHLCEELSKLRINWNAMSRIDTNPEVFEYMKLGGCSMIAFGIESLTRQLKSGATKDIASWHKQITQTLGHLRELGMFSKGYFILDDFSLSRQDLEQEKQAILDSQCDIIRIFFMIYSPGTSQYDLIKETAGFSTKNFDLFSSEYPILKILDMSSVEIGAFRTGIYQAFYSRARYRPQAMNMIQRFPRLRQSYIEFNEIIANSLGKGFL